MWFLQWPGNPHVLLTFGEVQDPHKMTVQRPKVVRTWCAFHILTSKRALGHNGVLFSTSQVRQVVWTCGVCSVLVSKGASHHSSVHFLNISTSKSAPRMACFAHFDFEMCFAPQRRTLFQCVLNMFTSNVLRATVACAFLTCQLPKVARSCDFLAFSLPNLLRATAACNFWSHICPDGSAPAALESLLFRPSGVPKH